LDAFNQRDLDALLATYAEDAQQFEHASKLLARGRNQIKERYAARFAEPLFQATLIQRMCLGEMVIDHEMVTRTFPEGPGHLELAAIYQVRGGQIVAAWFLAGTKTLLAKPTSVVSRK
jgi:putative hydrolase of HD superfamily